MNNGLSFLKEYCRNARDTGSVAPDSATLVNALLKHAPLASAKKIIEYGPASGVVTREIIKRMNTGADLVCVEKNLYFYDNLVKNVRGKNVLLVHDDAFAWARSSTAPCGMGGGSVDCIISTLPCSSIDFEAFLRISVLPLLRENGVFIQYMHTVSVLKGFRLGPILGRHFSAVGSELVLANVPPTLVYTSSGAL